MDINKSSGQLPIFATTQISPKSRTWVEISKSAILHNLKQIKNITGPEVQIAPVIKGNAYGHGLVQVAQICQESPDVGWVCVFSLSEALILRDNGFTKHILVLGYADVDLDLAIIHSIDLLAYDLNIISDLAERANKLKIPAYIHFKVDTGLSRLGFPPSESFEIIKKIMAFEWLKIRGLMSHFSESDAPDQSFTDKQLSSFINLIDKLKKNGINIPFIHTANTTGIIRFTSCHFNFVRTGGGTYGLYKSNSIKELGERKYLTDFKSALSWKSKVMTIKDLPIGSYVSYARTFITFRDTKIAIIPVGYWDGYSRYLSNKGVVYINGKSAPVIGRVCMNMVIVDITDIQNVSIGNEVTLVGNEPGIRPDDIAQLTGTINYEVTIRINPSISRIIV